MSNILDDNSQTIQLADGRLLGYIEAGDPEGKALFHFHGLNSSRLEVNIIQNEMLKSGIRIIGVDRPGMGLSTFQENRKVLDFVDDIVALADHLAIEKFSVMGTSSGCKYVLACAYKISHRLLSCHIISGASPMEFINDDMDKTTRTLILLLQKAPWLIEPVYWFSFGRYSQEPSKEEKFVSSILFTLGEVDKSLLENDTIKQMLVSAFRESYIQGSRGVAYDARFDLLASSWGFDFKDIEFTPIHFWHGALDKGMPLSMAKIMVDKISGTTLRVFDDEGHLSIAFNKIDVIVEDIVKDMNKNENR